MGCSNAQNVETIESRRSKHSIDLNNSNQTANSSYISEAQSEIDINSLITIHNNYRKKHGCPNLKNNDELNEMATKYAHQYLESEAEIFSSHTYNGEALGENIFIYKKEITIGQIFQYWYNEHKNYNYEVGKLQKDTTHFTQMIWKNTEFIGIGISSNRDKSKFCLVIYYYPAGNIFGKFIDNVPKEIK